MFKFIPRCVQLRDKKEWSWWKYMMSAQRAQHTSIHNANTGKRTHAHTLSKPRINRWYVTVRRIIPGFGPKHRNEKLEAAQYEPILWLFVQKRYHPQLYLYNMITKLGDELWAKIGQSQSYVLTGKTVAHVAHITSCDTSACVHFDWNVW